MHAASYHYTQLHPLRNSSDPELDYELQLLEVDLSIRRGELERALKIVNKRITTLKSNPAAGMRNCLGRSPQSLTSLQT